MTPARRRNSSPPARTRTRLERSVASTRLRDRRDFLDCLQRARDDAGEDRRGAEESQDDEAGERPIQTAERAKARADPAKQDERCASGLALEVSDEKPARAVLSAVRLDRRVGHLGPVSVGPDPARAAAILRRLPERGDRPVSSEEDRRMVGEPELERVDARGPPSACPASTPRGPRARSSSRERPTRV